MHMIEAYESLYNRLREHIDEEITIWDYVPAKQAPPFVVLGQTTFNYTDDLQTKMSAGYVLQQDIHVVTEAMERHKALNVVADIKEGMQEPLVINKSILYKQKINNGSVEETENGLFYAELQIELWLEDL